MAFFAATTAITIANPAYAQATPFVCDGNIYQVASGQLRVYDPLTSTYTDVGTAQGSYNAVGYNVLDNFAYGILGGTLVRIRSDGSVETLFPGIGGSSSGDMDDVGNLWVRTSNIREYNRINVTTGAVTTVSFTGPIDGNSDFIFIRQGGVPFIVAVHSGTIQRLNLDTNVAEIISASGLPGGGYGAQWTDSTGRIFAFRNADGSVYEIFDAFSATPSAVLVGTGVGNSSNDGFSCPTAPFPNLQPIAQDDDFTAAFGAQATGNLLADNGNGTDNDPEGTTLTVNTTPITPPSNGNVTIAANGDFTYTPNTGFFGVETFTYQITDSAGVTDSATVTINIPAPPIDLITTKVLTSSDTNPAVGDTVTFTITVENNGPAPATGVSLTDQLPAGMTATANNGNVSQGSYASATGVWTIGTLATGASVTLTIEGTVDSSQGGSTIQNTTTVASGAQSDPTTTGDDLTESITVDNTIVATNDDFSSTLAASTGATTASIFANDTLNAATFAQSAVTPTITDNDGLTGLVLNADGTFTVPNGTAPGTYNVQYQLCDASDASVCSTATAIITVAPTADLILTLTNTPGVNAEVDQSSDTVTFGNVTTYTLTVTNNGPDAITGAVATAAITSGLTCNAADAITITGSGAPSGSFTIGDLTGAGVTLGTLNNGDSTVITYNCTVS